MNTTGFAAAFARLCDGDAATEWGLSAPGCAGLEAGTVIFNTADAAWQALVEAAPRAGWLQWQSRQQHFEGALPEAATGDGALIAAEVVVSDTESLRVDHVNAQWRVTRYRHDPDGDGYLFDEVHHLLHAADGRLRYRRYWRLDPTQGAVQHRAVLIGIDPPEGSAS